MIYVVHVADKCFCFKWQIKIQVKPLPFLFSINVPWNEALSFCALTLYKKSKKKAKKAKKPNTLIITLASARAIIKVSGHQHQWFPGVSQVVTM